jgi:hypothetical protein
MTEMAEVYSPEAAGERPWSKMQGRFLNHAELVYQPGERDLAKAFFALLGFEVKELNLPTVLFGVDGLGQQDYSNNAIYASEVLPEQHALAEALRKALETPEIASLHQAFDARRRNEPQYFPHFGMRLSQQSQAEAIARIEALDDPRLEGRIALRVFGRDEPNVAAPGMIQAFIFTDIVSNATFPTGMVFELQVVADESQLLSRRGAAKAES